MNRILFLLFTAHLIALSPANSSADNFQPQLKALMDRYKQVEDQLARSVHYRKKEGTEPEITIQQAWYNGGGELLKVATERADAAGRELKEYVSIDDEDEPAKVAMFILTRRETRLPEGATRVEEERTCLGSSDLTGLVELRKLTKQAEFNAGQALDMERVPNVVHAPPKRSSRDTDVRYAPEDAE